MDFVTSRDGTSIAYERRGDGPAVVLVGGGLDDGSENAALVPALAHRFTVYNYARRGRGDSGGGGDYAVAREVEDLGALVEKAGGRAHVFGASSGGALVLEAAAAGLAADRLAVYEVPYMSDDAMAAHWSAYVEELTALLAADRRSDAVALFMRLAGSSDEDVAAARESPFWPGLRELAPTLAHDAACLGDGLPPVDRLARVARPTLVATGGVPDEHMSGLQPGFFDAAADSVAAALPDARRLVVEGQSHVADPAVFADTLTRFFLDGS